MERVLSHYADAFTVWGSITRAMGPVHPFFLRTGGGASAEKLRAILVRLCTENPIMAFAGLLFCRREHGPGACKLIPPAVSKKLIDGAPSPPRIFCTADKLVVAQAYADLMARVLFDIKTEVEDTMSSGARKDGHSAPTTEWAQYIKELMQRCAHEGAGWAPDREFGEMLMGLARTTSAQINEFQRGGFNTPPRKMTGAVPGGVLRVVAVATPPKGKTPRETAYERSPAGVRDISEPSPKARRTVQFSL